MTSWDLNTFTDKDAANANNSRNESISTANFNIKYPADNSNEIIYATNLNIEYPTNNSEKALILLILALSVLLII